MGLTEAFYPLWHHKVHQSVFRHLLPDSKKKGKGGFFLVECRHWRSGRVGVRVCHMLHHFNWTELNQLSWIFSYQDETGRRFFKHWTASTLLTQKKKTHPHIKTVAFCYWPAAALLPLCCPGDSAPVNVKWIARLGSSLPRWLIDPPVNTTAGEIHKAGKCYLDVRLLCARSLKYLRAREVFFLFSCRTYPVKPGCLLASRRTSCGNRWEALTKKQQLLDAVGSPEVPAP